MCAYIAIIAAILQVNLWCMNSATALRCNGYGLESWLARHLKKGSVHWRGRPGMQMYSVRECKFFN